MTDAPSPPPARRYLSLALPCLSTDRIHRLRLGRSWRSAAPRDRLPLVVADRVKSALRLVSLDEAAERLGLRRGMALADARAMIPALDAADADDAADAALLEDVAGWAERYTPLVALDPPDGLMLDITGSAHLFGGEATMVGDLLARLERQGFLARAAIADTPGAASAAARYTPLAVIAQGEAEAVLAPLPLAALRLDPAIVAALDRVGLKRIGQVSEAPRAPLAARFGSGLLRRLDQALGREEEAINPRRPVPALLAERRFAEPIAAETDVSGTISSLAAALAATLESRGLGARAYEASLFRVDGVVTRLAVGTSRPVRAPKLVLGLFREKLAGRGEEIDAGFGFDMVRLAVTRSESVESSEVDLAGDAVAEADLDELIDRIGARLGSARVGRIVARASHIPERAAHVAVAGEDQVGLAVAAPDLHSAEPVFRPLRLFARPEPVEAVAEVPDGPPLYFRWRRALYRVVRAEGPERIAPEWWQESDSLSRDYFRIEDADGHRFWLFRDGLYGRETAIPRWYLHGVFA